MTDKGFVQPDFEELKAVLREYLSPEDGIKVLRFCRELVAFGKDQKEVQKKYIDLVKTESGRELLLALLGRTVTVMPPDKEDNTDTVCYSFSKNGIDES